MTIFEVPSRICPQDGSVIEYYGDRFEDVLILLHPFIRPVSIDFCAFYPETWPSKSEIVSGCTPVGWTSVLAGAKFDSLSEIDVALRTSITSLKKERATEEFATRLIEYTEHVELVCPPEGDLPPLLENRLLAALARIGQKRVWVVDEFGSERNLAETEALINSDAIPPHGALVSETGDILVATHWDSCCSYLCGASSALERIVSDAALEAFRASAFTEVYWGLHENVLAKRLLAPNKALQATR